MAHPLDRGNGHPEATGARVLPAAVGEPLLAFGLACVAVAAGLIQFPMLGLLGLGLGLPALVLLLAAGVLLRAPTVPSVWAAFGLGLFVAGVIALNLTAFEATMLAHQAALH